jgi:hypothetical protein
MSSKLFSNVFLLLLVTAAQVAAQEPIRWKFKPGQKLSYGIVQEMSITGGNERGDVNNDSHQQLDVTWEIDAVDAEESANAKLRFDRIRTKMTLPIGGLEYDSAADGPAVGMAAVNAPLYQALIKAPVGVQLSADGRVTSVTLPEEVQQTLKRIPTSSTIGDLAKPERFQALFLSGFPTLPPEKLPSSGYQWQIKSTASLLEGESQTIESNYAYEGTRDVDGKHLAVIRQTRTINFGGGDSPSRTVKEQSSESEILFDTNAGRLESSMLKHRLTIEIKLGAITGEQRVEQSIQVKLKDRTVN